MFLFLFCFVLVFFVVFFLRNDFFHMSWIYGNPLCFVTERTLTAQHESVGNPWCCYEFANFYDCVYVPNQSVVSGNLKGCFINFISKFCAISIETAILQGKDHGCIFKP